MKKCPFCAEQIQDEAIKCRYCGSDLSAAHVTPVPETTPASDPVRQEAERLLKAGKKIQAVKFVREQKHIGLKEAKDYVDALEKSDTPELDATAGSLPWDDPSGGDGATSTNREENKKSASNTKKGFLGCLGVVVLLIVIGSLLPKSPSTSPESPSTSPVHALLPSATRVIHAAQLSMPFA